MERARRILIAHAKGDPWVGANYVLRVLAEEWRKQGLEIEVATSFQKPTGPDVLVFPHLDRTKNHPGLTDLFSRSARVINRSVTDISKRAVSRHLLESTLDFDGPVIVKTDLNYGGAREIRDIKRRGGPGVPALRALERQPWQVSGLLRGEEYRLYDHPTLVPRAVWSNPRLVVEKFLPEREGDLYCLRQYLFLGDCEVSIRSFSEQPIIKSSNVVRREVLDNVPDSVRAFRHELGFDFGKFDFVMHGDEAIVFDVARTPSFDANSKAGSAGSLMLKLVPGIEPFLGAA